jgi:uncharacterized membrane protein
MILKNLSLKKSKIPKWTVLVLLIVSGFGFLDATYLSVKHFIGATPTCSVFNGCEDVLASPYSMVGLVPVALMGSIYYVLIFVLTVAYIDLRRSELLILTAWLTLAGFIATLWFVYLQVFVINALCLYCLLSAVMATLLFVSGTKILKVAKSSKKTQED